jgi:hypothetical protein
MISPTLVQALAVEKVRAADPYSCCNGEWCRTECRAK